MQHKQIRLKHVLGEWHVAEDLRQQPGVVLVIAQLVFIVSLVVSNLFLEVNSEDGLKK